MKREIIGIVYIDDKFNEAKIEMTASFYEIDGVERADLARDIIGEANNIYDIARVRIFKPFEWLTYEEAGQKLGISTEAARQRAMRNKWEKTIIEGKARVKLPVINSKSIFCDRR